MKKQPAKSSKCYKLTKEVSENMPDPNLEFVFDIEADDLLHKATKIHVLSVTKDGENFRSTDNYDKMVEFFESEDRVFIGHNIIRYDIPLVKKILGVDVGAQLVDTLPLSWYLNFDRQKHGLEFYGEDYGVPKPVIKDWENLTYEDYRNRCQEDVHINWLLWQDLKKKLGDLYK